MPRAQAASNPAQRNLHVFAFDPLRFARLDNHLIIRVPYEQLKKGPLGRKVAVIDYDVSNGCSYEGIDLDAPAILGQNSLPLSEANPQFHQHGALQAVQRHPCIQEVVSGHDICDNLLKASRVAL